MPRVAFFEINAEDIDRATQFYTTVFGWEFAKWDGPNDYWLITTGKDTPGIDGGMMRRQADMPPASGNTIDVPSLDEYIAKVTAHGGTIVVPRMNIPGAGYMAYFADPDGNVFGMMEMDASAV